MSDPVQSQWYTIPVDRIPEESGTLSVLEYGKRIPFEVKRVFWVSGVPSPDIARGDHAHEELRQVIFCSHGSCKIDLESPSGKKETVPLTASGPALYLDGRVWRTMREFTADCSLIVLCDREYYLDTVVRDYEKFRSQ